MFTSQFRDRFRRENGIPSLKAVVLGAVLLAYSCAALAQIGAGGGQSGDDPTAGVMSGGKATGVVVKDELKDFHVALAVQANTQQIAEYAAMMKSTEAANAQLKNFLEQLGKQANASDLASHGAALAQAIEMARMEDKRFLDGFSEPQKSGLREIIRRLTKADADLAQQAKELTERVRDTKATGQPTAASAQSLGRALTNFQSQQIALAEEMNVGADRKQDSTFDLPPVKRSMSFAGQPVVITTRGVISQPTSEGSQSSFKLELTADLSDLQQNITEVLHAQLDTDERCGERIALQGATLGPAEPASLAEVQLHLERWSCRGGQANEMAESNGTIEVKLTPSVGADGLLRLTPEILRVDAQGLIGELLRSGSPGEILRDKIMEAILSAVRQGADFNTTLPPAARGKTTLRRAQFQGTGSGKLLVVLEAEIRVSNEQATSLTDELKSSELKGQSSAPATVPR